MILFYTQKLTRKQRSPLTPAPHCYPPTAVVCLILYCIYTILYTEYTYIYSVYNNYNGGTCGESVGDGEGSGGMVNNRPRRGNVYETKMASVLKFRSCYPPLAERQRRYVPARARCSRAGGRGGGAGGELIVRPARAALYADTLKTWRVQYAARCYAAHPLRRSRRPCRAYVHTSVLKIVSFTVQWKRRSIPA